MSEADPTSATKAPHFIPLGPVHRLVRSPRQQSTALAERVCGKNSWHPVILSAAKNLARYGAPQILRCAQDDVPAATALSENLAARPTVPVFTAGC